MTWFRESAIILCICAAATSARAQTTVPAPPAPWRLFGATTELAFSVDTTRIVRDGTLHSVWLRFDHAQPQPKPEVDGGPFQRTVVHVILECGRGRSRDVRMQLYHASGAQLVDYEFTEDAFRAIAQHQMRIYYDAVCRSLAAVPAPAG